MSYGWARLWTGTADISGLWKFIKHTLIFSANSLLILCAGGLLMTYIGDDETYPVHALLGMGYLMFLISFVPSCLIAFIITLKKFIKQRNISENIIDE